MNILTSLERVAAILRVLSPIAEQVESYLFEGGAEPAVFEAIPELRSPAALERAKQRARSTPPTG